jgi:hypothetical protein
MTMPYEAESRSRWVGMHKGEDVAYYLHKGYSVLAIEADPQLVEKAKQQFDHCIEAGKSVIDLPPDNYTIGLEVPLC